jgi:hypothetical protein
MTPDPRLIPPDGEEPDRAAEFERVRRGLISMDAPPPVGNDGSGPPQDYDG